MTLREARGGKERIEGYKVQSLHYLENASDALRDGELEKATEFLWGAFAEAVKAFALSRDFVLRNHDEIRRFVRDLSKELGDKEIQDAFVRADRFHSNFYEGFLDLEDIAEGFEHIKRGVQKLLGLLDNKTYRA